MDKANPSFFPAVHFVVHLHKYLERERERERERKEKARKDINFTRQLFLAPKMAFFL